MSRPLRIEYPYAWYHVMNRGRRYEAIFEDKNDYSAFIELLQDSIDIFHIKVAAFCLMQNHYHLLIQTPEGNMSRSMRHINGVYTQRFNRIHGYDGHLFRGRYKSILIDADSYLLQVMRYIHREKEKGTGKLCLTSAQYYWYICGMKVTELEGGLKCQELQG